MGNGNNLSRIEDGATILDLLQGTKEKTSEVFIWRFVGGEKHLCLVKLETVRKARNDFSIIPGDGQDRLVQEMIGSQSSVDLYIPDAALLLRCKIKQTDAPFRYYLEIPSFVAQANRRNNLRLNVQEQNDVKLNFGKSVPLPRPITQHFHKSCFDLSPGGLSFNVSKSEAKLFRINDLISGMELKAGNWSAKFNSEVVSILEIEPDVNNGLAYKVWRVCCRFEQIDQISKKYLEKYIFERIKDELHAING